MVGHEVIWATGRFSAPVNSAHAAAHATVIAAHAGIHSLCLNQMVPGLRRDDGIRLS